MHEKEGFIEMIFFFNFSKQDHFKMTEELLFSGEKGSRKVHFCLIVPDVMAFPFEYLMSYPLIT